MCQEKKEQEDEYFKKSKERSITAAHNISTDRKTTKIKKKKYTKNECMDI